MQINLVIMCFVLTHFAHYFTNHYFFWVLVVTLVPYLSYTKGLNSVENGKASRIN